MEGVEVSVEVGVARLESVPRAVRVGVSREVALLEEQSD